MNKRFLDILTFIINEIREQSRADVDLQTLVDMLEDEGFSEDEITSAMSWLMSHGENLDRVVGGGAGGLACPGEVHAGMVGVADGSE